MKIKFEESIAGPHFSFRSGSIVEYEQVEALRLCERGIASPADPAAEKLFEAYDAQQKKIAAEKAAAAAKAVAIKKAEADAKAATIAREKATAVAAKAAKIEAETNAKVAMIKSSPQLIPTR